MENDCPCCQRKIKVAPIAARCEYCAYEFRPQIAAEAPRPRSGAGTFLVYTTIGAALLFAAYSAPEVLKRFNQRQLDAVAPVDDVHKVLATTEGGRRKAFIWGRVFDVKTLKPIERATIVFQDPDSDTYFGAFTNANGKYRAWLPASRRGYYVTIHHPYYAPAFTSDWTPSLRSLSETARRDVAHNLLASPQEQEWLLAAAGKHFKKDYALAPKLRR